MFPGIGMQELVVIGVIAIVLFGKRLPSVARGWGKTYFEFKKGLFDIQKNFDPQNFMDDDPSSDSDSYSAADSYEEDVDDHDEAASPRFELPPSDD